MNRIILLGRLTEDPEVRYTNTGKVVAQFTLAVDRGFAGADGMESFGQAVPFDEEIPF